jgi:hypothetical protein
MTSGQVERTCRRAAGKATKKASPCVSTSTPPRAANILRRISRCSAVDGCAELAQQLRRTMHVGEEEDIQAIKGGAAEGVTAPAAPVT